MKIYLAIREMLDNDYFLEIEGVFTKKQSAECFCAKNKLALYEYEAMDNIDISDTEIFKVWQAQVGIDGRFETIVSRLSEEDENKVKFVPYFKPYFEITVSLAKDSTLDEAADVFTKTLNSIKEKHKELCEIAMDVYNRDFATVERLETLADEFNSEN
jgi:uncharacterized protein YciU (UPF0263 family)